MIIEVLEKIEFSFWHLLLMLFVLIFRSDLGSLIRRVATIKFGDKELILHPDKTVSDLKEIKEQLEREPAETYKAINLITEKIDKNLIVSLSSIRRETSHLWPAIKLLEYRDESKAEIQGLTLEKVKSNLQAIEDAGLMTYDIDYIGPEQYEIREVKLRKLDRGLERLIIKVTGRSL
ncbi:hypothetical protein R50073_02230 [Maricurvus nonylphenolicus]|uniref:hypothetical protein n=1 Tax=Maricurvus nonylphenolicus TaxID=1008307 RepID=UPI0036F24667